MRKKYYGEIESYDIALNSVDETKQHVFNRYCIVSGKADGKMREGTKEMRRVSRKRGVLLQKETYYHLKVSKVK